MDRLTSLPLPAVAGLNEKCFVFDAGVLVMECGAVLSVLEILGHM